MPETLTVKVGDFNALVSVLRRVLQDSLRMEFITIGGYTKADRAQLVKEVDELKAQVFQENDYEEENNSDQGEGPADTA